MIKIITFSLILFTITINSQTTNFDAYKYIIVPNKLSFVKNIDEHQTSSLTKFLLQKKGFEVFLSNETFPNDLIKNKCLALIANVFEESSMMTTKNIIKLKDCNNNVVLSSNVGKSKLKDFKKGYHEAIRNAYKSMFELKYSYVEVKEDAKTNNNSDKIITPVKLVSKVIITPNIKQEVIISKVKTNKTIDSIKTSNSLIKTPIGKSIIKSKLEDKVSFNKEVNNILYSQPIENGFQLVNTKPEVVFQILKTNRKDFFIIKGKNGVLYKSDANWVAEYYQANQLVVKKYQIKF